MFLQEEPVAAGAAFLVVGYVFRGHALGVVSFACYRWFGGLKGIFPVQRRLTLYALAGA